MRAHLAQQDVASQQGSKRFRSPVGVGDQRGAQRKPRLRLQFQSIVDLTTASVVGYEVFAVDGSGIPLEFTGSNTSEIHRELRFIGQVLRSVSGAPPGCFLSVNLSGGLLNSPELLTICSQGLEGVIFEISEHCQLRSVGELVETLSELRRRGARIALDRAGTGFGGLQLLAQIRPDIVKLDASLVRNIAHDSVRRVLATTLSDFTTRLNSWTLADGIDTEEDLDTLVDLGISLGQGPLLGGPSELYGGIDAEILGRISELRGSKSISLESVTKMIGAPAAPNVRAIASGSGEYVELDIFHRPYRLWRSGCATELEQVPVTLQAEAHEDLAVLIERALLRPLRYRFDPIVVVDRQGSYLGLARLEELVTQLALSCHLQNRAS